MSAPREVDRTLLTDWPLPPPGAHKHARGVVGIVGGSATTPGSLLLAAESAFRMGAGKVRVATVATCAPALAVAVPEAAVGGFAETGSGDLSAADADLVADFVSEADVLLLGTGFVDPGDADELLAAVLLRVDCDVVVDGVGTAYVDSHREELRRREGHTVLTMNPVELSHLADTDPDTARQETAALTSDLARSTGCVVVCGGEQKIVATPDEGSYVVRGGGPGLGVSGSGDVHAGLVAGLLARTRDPVQSAVWGAWLHASAGDLLALEVATVGFLARELPSAALRLLADFR